MEWLEFLVPSVHLAELFIRGTVTYLGLMLLLRIVGQREAGGLGMTDLLVVLLAVNAATAGLTGDADNLGDGFVLVVTVLFWSIVLDALAWRWPRLGRVLKARPRPLVIDGELNRRAMRREFMSEDEVVSHLRLHGIEDVSRVARAHIEPNGMVSVILRNPEPEEEDSPPAL